jgi:hypothetical protein
MKWVMPFSMVVRGLHYVWWEKNKGMVNTRAWQGGRHEMITYPIPVG